MQRIGIATDLSCSYNGESHPTAITEIKASIDADRGVVLWGVDTGEFGVIYGYDDNDGVFFVSGIGGNDSKESNPILYQNLGSTFGNVLFCQFPLNYTFRPMEHRINDSLHYYIQHMKSGNTSYGLKAYDNLVYALEHECDDYGLRYTTGVYTERKQQASSFFNDEVKELYKNNAKIEKAAELYNDISKLYGKIHYEILNQSFEGWNHLNKPVDSEIKKAIVPIIKEIALKENEVINLIDNTIK